MTSKTSIAVLFVVKFIKRGFSQPRKVISSNLATDSFAKAEIISALEESGLAKTSRAAELTTEDWHKLYSILNA